MTLNVSDEIHGVIVTRIRQIEQLDGRLVEMRHKDSGAELCWMDNGVSNKQILAQTGIRL